MCGHALARVVAHGIWTTPFGLWTLLLACLRFDWPWGRNCGSRFVKIWQASQMRWVLAQVRTSGLCGALSGPVYGVEHDRQKGQQLAMHWVHPEIGSGIVARRSHSADSVAVREG